MALLPIFLISFLISSHIVFGLPLSTNETTTTSIHLHNKRDTLICGFAARLVDNKSCLPAGINFVLNAAQTAVTEESLTTNAAGQFEIPANKASQCDHIIELALLNSMFNKNGFCAVANVLGSSFSAGQKVDFLNTPINLVNAAAANANSIAQGTPVNLVFLDTKLNIPKKNFVTSALNNPGVAPTNAGNLNTAIKSYLTQTRTQSLRVAQAIDAACLQSINALKASTLSGVVAPAPNVRAKTATERLAQAVAAHDALVGANPALTITAQWTEVLNTP
ncbi:hypothetical protein SISSUDRAFT_1118967 [Sistotremastrum suecicum HHB10207 ss-3]|uniref:Uncharacterized protein n=1 Tax=Sistotremastrum suecicum HHB10207 ss-3 TaxID=1314776 RepID=A0A166EC86_9AGAM|nr:hypothetical protein SISSUDRAFT_1118967 [Sistotremastrum suecicum HHB10207 ss-3]